MARRFAAPVVVAIIALALSPAGSGTAVVTVNDAATAAGIAQPSKTWSANVADFNNDGWDDVLIVRHGYHGDIYVNDKDGTFSLWQALPGRPERPDRDRHDCDWGLINADTRLDIYCSIGAGYGTAVKENEVWIQGVDGHFTDLVDEYGAVDAFGRGRFVTFVDVKRNDAYPDLFVGNIDDRQDEHPSPNRFFENEGGTGFRDAPEYGITLEERAFCAERVDIDSDGWEDLVVCSELWLRVYRNVPGSTPGTRKFTDIAKALGLADRRGRFAAASFADFNKDGKPDIAYVTAGFASIRLQGATKFGAVVANYDTKEGRSVPTGDFDGDGDVDVLVVDGDTGSGGNAPDVLLQNNGNGSSWTVVSVPGPTNAKKGIGDFGETIDYNHDGRADFIVLNGQVSAPEAAGNAQLFTSASAPPPPDTTDPTVTVVTPGQNASYLQGSTVNANYSCADEAGGSGLASCTGTVPNGSPIDTATLGSKTFTVTGTDNAGNDTTVTRTYTVQSSSGNVLTVTKTGNGTVRSTDLLIRCGADCTENYPEPTSVTLNIIDVTGWVFSHWGGAAASCGTTRSCTLTVSGTTGVTATFVRTTATQQRAV
jgi:hypothetical protein